jgi:hypothetical protein
MMVCALHSSHDMPSRVLLVLITSAGCLGSIDDVGPNPPGQPDGGITPPAGATARQLFDATVFPIISGNAGKCAGGACHSAGSSQIQFVAATTADSYTQVTGQPKLIGGFTTAAPILTKITPKSHYATYTTDEVGAITTWLAKEVDERGQQHDLLREFTGCLKLEDFVATQISAATGGAESSDQGECKTCHAHGEYNHVTGDLESFFYTTITTDRSYLAKYFTLDPTNTQVVVNEAEFAQMGVTAPHTQHGTFDLNGTNMTTLRDFYTLATQHLADHTCDAPRF